VIDKIICRWSINGEHQECIPNEDGIGSCGEYAGLSSEEKKQCEDAMVIIEYDDDTDVAKKLRAERGMLPHTGRQ